MSATYLDDEGAYRAPALKACDACRLRKLRCESDASASPPSTAAICARCHRLGIRCTFEIPTGKRGPKRKQKDNHDAPDGATSTSASSPASLQNPRPRINLASSVFLTNRICSRELLHILMQDYLASLYSLLPVVHRPSFRLDLSKDRDAYDEDFLGLIVAICAVVVALLRSRFDTYRSYLSGSSWAQSRVEIINRCHSLLTSLRGPTFFDEIGYQKWAASYLMSIALFQVGELNRARMVEVECMQLGRLLNLHRIEQYRDLDCIETQLRKKGFWLLFYGYIHAQIQNLRKERLTFLDHSTLASINLGSLMPVDVEDEQIFKHQIVPLPQPVLGLTTGFIIHSRVFWHALESPYGTGGSDCLCCRSRSPAAQEAHLRGRLQELKYALDDAPAQLRQWALSHQEPDTEWTSSSQLATLRANIHVTHLWLQSILLDHLDSLSSPEENWPDREVLSSQLLHVLHNIPQRDIEPNGLHLVYKVRDVAVGLLTCPFSLPDPSAKRAQGYVREFTDIMACLDASERVNTANLQSWVDTGRSNKIGVELVESAPGDHARPS